MIHLDTNHLIRLLVAGSPQALQVDQWLASGESLAASALAWAEFLNGPVPIPQVALVKSVIASRVVAFDGAHDDYPLLLVWPQRGRGAYHSSEGSPNFELAASAYQLAHHSIKLAFK